MGHMEMSLEMRVMQAETLRDNKHSSHASRGQGSRYVSDWWLGTNYSSQTHRC